MEPVCVEAALADGRSLCDLLLATASEQRDRVALRTSDGSVELTHGQAIERIAAIAGGLLELGVRRDEATAIMLVNRPEFHLVDAAAMLLGAVPFSIFNSSAPEQVRYVLRDAGARIIVTELRFLEVVRAAVEDGARVDHIVLVDDEAEGCISLDALERGGSPIELRTAAQAVGSDDLLTLIYTSGTTGPPKGVEITHGNMLAQLRAVHEAVPLPGGGRQVSFLPSAHIADRWTSHYSAFMTYGNAVTSVADSARTMDVVAAVRPTLFGAVPRVWEKTQAALEVAMGPDLAEQARGNPALAAGVRHRLGLDEAQWLLTGAAPTPIGVIDFFEALGLQLCECFGMSETAGVVAVNAPEARRPGSVGRLVNRIELRLAEDNELLLRGGQVMRGYRNMPEQTADAVDPDGWLRTGDVARVDDDGFLWIIDRKKELIINSAGKNMSPANIEMQLRSAGPLIGQAYVVGDGRPYNVALLVLDPQAAAGADPADPAIVSRVKEEVERANAHLSTVEQIKRFALLAGDWLPDGDELTPTMKLKRRAIYEKYAHVIEGLYAADHGTPTASIAP